MKIIKRSGAEAIFDANKIAQAVKRPMTAWLRLKD